MKTTTHRLLFIGIILIILILLISLGFILEKKFHHRFSPPHSTKQLIHTARNDKPLVTCQPNDAACQTKNEAIIASRLTGTAVAFARHQCDGPRACPNPTQDTTAAATKAIQTYAKDSSLKVVRVTGINAAGVLWYCASDNRCWSVENKTLKVISFIDGNNLSSPSPVNKGKK